MSLVRGREWWRIVNVEPAVSEQVGDKKFLAEAADFLLRLIHGEGEYAAIFADISLCEQNILRFKTRALVELGYLPSQWATAENYSDEELAKAIEAGLSQSQL